MMLSPSSIGLVDRANDEGTITEHTDNYPIAPSWGSVGGGGSVRSLNSMRSFFRDNRTVHSVVLTGDVVMDERTERLDVVPRRMSKTSGHHRRTRTVSGLSVFNVIKDEQDEDLLAIQLPERFVSGSLKEVLSWFGKMFLAGMGMFVQAFIIITTGQIKTIWRAEYPECWIPDFEQKCPNNIDCSGLFSNTPEDLFFPTDECTVDGEYPPGLICSQSQISAVSYSQFAGIMAGMLLVGAVCDLIGRKQAGIITSLLMLLGISVMTFIQTGEDISLQFTIWSTFFAVFGFGVGGEYPLSASLAAEMQTNRADDAQLDDLEKRRRRVELDQTMTQRRGETIALVFSMQGAGALFGSTVLLVLIYFAHQGHISCNQLGNNSTGNNPNALNGIWRSFYFIGLLLVSSLLIYRFLILEESHSFEEVERRKKKRAQRQKMLKSKTTLDVIRFYWPRLIGTSGCWFLWDVSFYGLGLFSGPIFEAINPEGNLLVTNGWLLFSNFCALLGCYAAASVIDSIGRKRLQMFSFLVCTIIFTVSAVIFETAPAGVIMLLFFLSAFFGGFGPNVTTYVMAAETYPTELRSTCHGISAFAGKMGALCATIVFGYVETTSIFYIAAAASILGFVFTFVFSCDLTHVSLAEHDAQLELFLGDRPEKYGGILNKSDHLSNFEIWTGRHGEYDELWASKFVVEESMKVEKEMRSSESKSSKLNSLVKEV